MKIWLKGLWACLLLWPLLVSAEAQPNGITDEVQNLKQQVLELNRDLFLLEEELLFPSNTQVSIFLSMDVGEFFQLDSVTLKIDGKDVTVKDNPYLFLENTVGKRIAVTVSANADGSGARTSMVKPIRSDQELRYLDWVESRRQLVDKLSGGKIGYIHVPNTAVEGNRELFKGMLAEARRDALIIDDRYNGGGFIPEGMAFTIGARQLNFWSRRYLDLYTQPAVVHTGPAVMIDGFAVGLGLQSAHASVFSVCLSLYIMEYIAKRDLVLVESRRSL